MHPLTEKNLRQKHALSNNERKSKATTNLGLVVSYGKRSWSILGHKTHTYIYLLTYFPRTHTGSIKEDSTCGVGFGNSEISRLRPAPHYRSLSTDIVVVILSTDNVCRQGEPTADTSQKYGMACRLTYFWLVSADNVGGVSAPAPHVPSLSTMSADND